MRIAFFGDTSYVGTREWAAWLASADGVELHVVDMDGGRCDIEGAAVHRLPRRPLPGKAAYLACIPDLRLEIGKIGPDILIAYRVVSYGFSASMAGFHPLVLAAQGQFIVSPETPRFFRIFARRAVRKADMMHAWAPPMATSLVGLGADPERILTLPRGVDDEHFTPEEGSGPAGPLTMITTRKLEPYYNFQTLLEAVREIRPRVGALRYLIAGEGGQREELEETCRKMGLDDCVSFLGAVSRERLPALLRSCHLYISAVPSDGTSSSLLEAMACGVPSIVADNESNRHWIREGVTGRLVPAFDSSGYARAIVEAWESPSWRSRAGAEGRRTVVERASWKRNMERFLAAYRALAEGRPWREGQEGSP